MLLWHCSETFLRTLSLHATIKTITRLGQALIDPTSTSNFVSGLSPVAAMAPPPSNATRIAEAKELSKTNPSKAETLYKDVLSKAPGSNEQALRDYENALLALGELYRDNKKVDELAELVKSSRLTLSSFAKAKTAKLG